MRESFDEARRLGDDWCGAEHILLALVRGEDPVADAYRNAGVTPDRVEAILERMRTPDRMRSNGIKSNAHWHEVVGRSDGFAAARGAPTVEAIDTAFSLLYERHAWVFEYLAVTRSAVAEQLQLRGFAMPAAPVPSPKMPPAQTQRVYIDPDQFASVSDALRKALSEPDSWGFNYDVDGRMWVTAADGVDLGGLVRDLSAEERP